MGDSGQMSDAGVLEAIAVAENRGVMRALALQIADQTIQLDVRVRAIQDLGSWALAGPDIDAEDFAMQMSIVLWALADSLGESRMSVVKASIETVGIVSIALCEALGPQRAAKTIGRPMAEGVIPALVKACSSASGGVAALSRDQLLKVRLGGWTLM